MTIQICVSNEFSSQFVSETSYAIKRPSGEIRGAAAVLKLSDCSMVGVWANSADAMHARRMVFISLLGGAAACVPLLILYPLPETPGYGGGPTCQGQPP